MSRRRLRWLLALGATGLALVAAEIGLRATSVSYAPRQGSHELDGPLDGLPYFRLTPNVVSEFSWDGDPLGVLPEGARIRYAIDASGYRSGRAGVDRARLVVLGDSFTFGEGVAVGERFSELLDEANVYNAGVPGYSLPDEAAVFAELVEACRPRGALVVVQPNDAIPLPHALERVDGDLLREARDGGGLRLLDLVAAPWRASGSEQWYRDYWTGERQQFGAEALAAIKSMARTAEARGVRLGVAVFPLLHRLDDYPLQDVHDRIIATCERSGVPVLDLAPTFAGRDAPALWVHPTDHHPNPAAHAIAAAALRPFVAELLAD